MKLTKRLKIGTNSYSFSFEGSDLWECLMDAQKISLWDLEKCGSCGSDLLSLRAYKTKEKGYKYVVVSCGRCKSKLTLGQKRDDGTFFYRKDDSGSLAWEEFENKDNTKNIKWED